MTFDVEAALCEYADAVDKDRGFPTGLTRTMREAATEIKRLKRWSHKLLKLIEEERWNEKYADLGHGMDYQSQLEKNLRARIKELEEKP